MRHMPFILLAILLVACAPDERTATEPDSPREDLVWPQPPAQPRIKFLYAFGEPGELGIRRGFFKRLWSIIAGKENLRMLRPYAVAVDGPTIAVADPGLRAVHLFDTGTKRYRRIGKLGQDVLVSPVGVAIGEDRIYLSDSALGKVFAINAEGELLATIGDLERPTGLAYDRSTARLYVTETLGHRISAFDGNGVRLQSFGQRGKETGRFNYPTHLSLSRDRLYVNDTMNFRLQAFELDGDYVSAFGRHGDGSGDFAQPKGIATDEEGHIYVVDALFNRVQIFDGQGRFLLAFGGEGHRQGQFWLPAGMFIAGDRLYVADSYNRRIQVFQFLGGG